MSPVATATDLEIASRVRLAVTRLSRRLRQAAPPGPTPSMLSALSSLVRRGPFSLRQLADVERVQPPTMSRIVESLISAGFIVRVPNPADGRSALLEATVEGRSLIRRRARRTDAFLAEQFRVLSDREMKTLRDAAGIFERILENNG
jgi:DNA-binding MarR family transcriptional regulator